jgi:hypothetical protein
MGERALSEKSAESVLIIAREVIPSRHGEPAQSPTLSVDEGGAVLKNSRSANETNARE